MSLLWSFVNGRRFMSLMAVSLMESFLSATHTLYQAGGSTPLGDIGRTC